MKNIIQISRRKFLQIGSVTALVPSIIHGKLTLKENNEDKVEAKNILNYHPDMRYRQLGHTSLYLSVLSLGGGELKAEVANYAINKGINLIHISKHYSGGRSIKELGKVLKTKRDMVYIALKADFDEIEPLLETLNTGSIDFLMFPRHHERDINQIEDIAKYEKYKQEGKVRMMGLTTHDQVKKCFNLGIQGGKYSLIMPSLNQPNLELLNEELTTAYKNNIAIIAMKTMKGIGDENLQAAFLKKVLKNPAVTTVVKGIGSFKILDMYLKTIKESLSLKEDLSLYRYAQKNRSNNCMMCGECEEVCPFNLAISTLLRSKYYYYDQLKEKNTAIMTYKEIPYNRRNTSGCQECRECEPYCPNGIAIAEKLMATNHFFSQIS
jgi:predicted aldo/keto reductase-like oxidoreductase